MAHNNNVGKISTSNVSIKGSGVVSTTTDQGSLIGLRYIKDDQLGTGSPTTTVANVGSVALKNWFAQYVGALGKFTKASDDNENINFGSYRNSTILGFKVRVVNESSSRYKNSNNAGIRIQPLNGALGSYTVTAGEVSTTSSGGEVELGRAKPSYNSGRNVSVAIRDNTTGLTIAMNWQTAYGSGGGSFITGSQTVGIVGQRFNFTWSSGNDSNRDGTYSNYLYFFMGSQDPRPYGSSYT